MIERTLPGFRAAVTGEWVEERRFEERDWDFPWLARSGSVSAIARTREGAVAMVEQIKASRG